MIPAKLPPFYLYLLAGTCFCLCATPLFGQIHYQGEAINLMTAPYFSLYRGKAKLPVAVGLDRESISQYAGQSEDVWWLETQLTIPEDVVAEGDVWLLLKSNVNACEIYLDQTPVLFNGKVGEDATSEQGGLYLRHQKIPRALLQKEKYSLRIRFSNHHFNCTNHDLIGQLPAQKKAIVC